MNKTKAKGLIEKLHKIDDLLEEVEIELDQTDFENLLGYAYDYTRITRKDLRRKYHINGDGS